MYRWTTYRRIILLVLLLMIPAIVLYGYSHLTSVRVIEHELEQASINRIHTLSGQMDNIVQQLSILAIIVSNDPLLKELSQSTNTDQTLQRLNMQESLIRNLDLLSATSQWVNNLIIYLPAVQEAYSNQYVGVYDRRDIVDRVSANWSYQAGEQGDGYFSKFIMSPLFMQQDPLQAESLVEVRFAQQNIATMLGDFQNANKGEAFLYASGQQLIPGIGGDPDMRAKLVEQLGAISLDRQGSVQLQLDDELYMVNYLWNEQLGWYLIDYMPLRQILQPIFHSRNIFYFAMALLIALSVVVAYFLYRQVQAPIRQLLTAVQGISRGGYSHRLKQAPKNEFGYLFERFNDMAAEIQHLIETVYEENIRFREAKLKQLQSQINPHFLYNCLFFVKNMIAVNDKEAATAMVLNLAQYYRYMTKLENTMTTLGDELALVRHYLDIQSLRMERFYYEIDIPESMMSSRVPRLLLQPIVENAVLHGIGNIAGMGLIVIEGRKVGNECQIVIDDNGQGLSEEARQALFKRVTMPLDAESGCGLWNISQRLQLQYNRQEGLQFATSPLGGLRVILRWDTDEGEEVQEEARGSNDAELDDR